MLIREVNAVTELVQGALQVGHKLEDSVQEGSAAESTRTRIERVLSEL
jgi:hypothetical protein